MGSKGRFLNRTNRNYDEVMENGDAMNRVDLINESAGKQEMDEFYDELRCYLKVAHDARYREFLRGMSGS